MKSRICCNLLCKSKIIAQVPSILLQILPIDRQPCVTRPPSSSTCTVVFCTRGSPSPAASFSSRPTGARAPAFRGRRAEAGRSGRRRARTPLCSRPRRARSPPSASSATWCTPSRPCGTRCTRRSRTRTPQGSCRAPPCAPLTA